MPAKITTTIKNIEIKVKNETNRQLISEFYAYLTSIDTSENYQNGLIKVLIKKPRFGTEKKYFQYLNMNHINEIKLP